MLLKYRQNSLTLTQCAHVCVSEIHTIKIIYTVFIEMMIFGIFLTTAKIITTAVETTIDDRLLLKLRC